MTYFVTRHSGARAWAEARGLHVDRTLAALDPAILVPGDRVFGTLPVHLAAQVCRAGARYFHLSLDLPLEARGRELSLEMMDTHHARLEEFLILPLGAAS